MGGTGEAISGREGTTRGWVGIDGRGIRPAALAVELDAGVVHGDVVPFYMNPDLQEFPRRIVDLADGSIIGDAGNLPGHVRLEAIVGLRSPGMNSVESRGERQPETGSGTSGPLDPLLQAWLRQKLGAKP